jgi:hypothetical protein
LKKIISYSLWGDLPLYTVGAISNAIQARTIYPDWICRFYIHKQSVPQNIVDELSKHKNVEIVFYHDNVGWGGMLYRFYPATEDDVSVMISRDTDSRLSLREKACVDDWLNNSNKKVHTIRDTCVHQSQMMGGLWGVRDGHLIWIREHIDGMLNSLRGGEGRKGLDQDFLNSKVYLYAVGDIDEYQGKIDPILANYEVKYLPNMLSHDDIAFGNLRFTKNTRLPHVNEEMRMLPIPREYGECYHACVHCGMKHDNKYIGKVESLTNEETLLLNLTKAEQKERENILKYYKQYLINQYKYGLSPVQHEHGSEKIT